REEPGGADWLARLPGLLEACIERWGLTLEEPVSGVWLSLVLPGRRADGADVVLKLPWPHRESEHEALALARSAGDAAVRLLEHDADSSALLLERCLPGTPLGDLDLDAQAEVYLDLLPRLWKPVSAPPFRS